MYTVRLPLLIFSVYLALVTMASAEPDADVILERLELVRSSDQAESAEADWKAFAQEFPVVTDWVVQDLGKKASEIISPKQFSDALASLAKVAELNEKASLDEGRLWKSYIAIRTARRAERLAPLINKWSPLVFSEAHTFKMSFIGYTEGLSDARHERFFSPGARLSQLAFKDGSAFATTRTLIDDPHGMIRDVDVSFDLKRVMFSWKKSDRLDDYHLYEYDLNKGNTRQLTHGLGRADYEPIYLPDGDIVFASTRPEQSVPCWWTEISNLYRADADGKGLRRLAIDQVHTLYPQLKADGRITYTRWDYSDRGQNFSHPLFSMRPDGKDQRAFYGANSWFPTSLLHARGIPGSHEVVAVASGHHTHQQGKLMIVDNSIGRDEGLGVRFIAPQRDVPYERVDRAMQGGDQFRYPYPLGDKTFLVSYRPEYGVPGFGLYWIHEDGSRELLHHASDLETGRPIPIGHRPKVETLPEEIDFDSNSAVYHVHDVYRGIGLEGIKRGTAKWIRVVRLEYRAAGVGKTHNKGEDGASINSSPVGISNTTWDVKEILGDAMIHEDGSAMFKVPAMQSIYLQVIDERGRVIQTTRTWDTLRPGETKGCAGCHDKTNGNQHPFHDESTMAWKHGAQDLQHPFHEQPSGFSFAKTIQPILDAKCISCHNGTDDLMDLRGTPVDGNNMNKRAWSQSYLNLLQARQDERNGNWIGDPDSGLVRWLHKQSGPTEIPPYHSGAARSPLIKMLDEGHHDVTLDQQEWFKLAAWIDLLVPYSGDYREGGAWSERDHAYYSYYETKRKRHSEEELESVLQWLKQQPSQSTEPETPSYGPLSAEYRMVIEHPQMIEVDGVLRLAGDSSGIMVDRIRVRAQAGALIRVIGTRKGEELAALQVHTGKSELELTLSTPSRADRLTIETITANTPVTVIGLYGVSVKEIPTVDGFHPYLGDELNDSN